MYKIVNCSKITLSGSIVWETDVLLILKVLFEVVELVTIEIGFEMYPNWYVIDNSTNIFSPSL